MAQKTETERESLGSPVNDLLYDWVTVLHSKAKGLQAYEKYIRDAEQMGATECVRMFRKLHKQDSKAVEEIKGHLQDVLGMAGEHGERSAS